MADPPVSNSIEAEFARRLAGNEKKTRDRALKKLRQFMDLRSQKSGGGFSRDDMLRIWKGLFYCMWMSDKPLVQEELAKNISDLMLQVKNVKTAMLFFEACLTTMEREWKGIDRLRMDKFYLLVRCVLNKGMEFLKRLEWDEGTVDWFIAILKNGPISHSVSPIGIHYHISDIYIEELSKVGGKDLRPEVVTKFLEPYCMLMARSRNFDFVNAVKGNVFQEVVENSEVALQVIKEEEQEFASAGGHSQLEASDDSPPLKVDYTAVADELFELASKDGILSRNRKIIYSVVKQFKELAAGRLPLDSIPDVDYSSEDELKKSEENLVDSLVSQQDEETVQNRKRMRGKKRRKEILRELKLENEKLKAELDDCAAEEETTSELREDDIESSPPKRRKKKRIVKEEEFSSTDKTSGEKKKLKKKKSLKRKKLLLAEEADGSTESESQLALTSDIIAEYVPLEDSADDVCTKKKKKKNKEKTASLEEKEENNNNSDSISKLISEKSGDNLKKKKNKKRKKKLSLIRQGDTETIVDETSVEESQKRNYNETMDNEEVSTNLSEKREVEREHINVPSSLIDGANIPDILQNVPDTEKPEKRVSKKPVTKGEKDLLNWLNTAKPTNLSVENLSVHDSASDMGPAYAASNLKKTKENLEISPVGTNVSSPIVSIKQRKKERKLSLQGSKLVEMKTSRKPPVTSAFFRVAASKVTALMENKHLAAIKRTHIEPVRAHSPKRVAFVMSKTQVQPFRKMDKSIAVSPSPNNVAFDPRKKPDFGLLKTRKSNLDQTPKKRKQAADFF